MLLSTCPVFWIAAVVESDSNKADEILEYAIHGTLRNACPTGSYPPELTKKKKSERAALDPNHSTILTVNCPHVVYLYLRTAMRGSKEKVLGVHIH